MRGLLLALLASSGLLGSCTAIPSLDGAAQLHTSDLVKRVKCDLILALRDKVFENRAKFGFLTQWSAKVHLTVIVDDTGAINPGVTFIEPLAVTGTSRSLGLGVGLSSQAVRTEDLEFFLSFSDVAREFGNKRVFHERYKGCRFEKGLFLESDLDIKSMFDRALAPIDAGVLHAGRNIPLPGGPPPIPPNEAAKIRAALEQLKAVPANAFVIMNEIDIPPDIKDKLPPTSTESMRLQAASQLARAREIERNTQAIIKNIVNPLYDIIAPIVGTDCIPKIAEARFKAIASSAVVSVNKIAADQAKTKPEQDIAISKMVAAENDVIAAAQEIVRIERDCKPVTPKKPAPTAYDPIDLISETVNFYVTLSGSVTPAWKLVRITAPLAPTFLSATRKTTNTLIIVMGRPVQVEDKVLPSSPMSQQILTSILREAITQQRLQ